jgi:(1->4)-alpha-D-glucan 1-alpha-D-glucosylmutase
VIGALNGLAQTLLKLTAPGVPDTFQGCELWDLSLVDPDNRRPVDFVLRRKSLQQPTDALALLASWRDGRIKQHLIARTLALRRRQPDLFATGSYEPLEVAGSLSDRVVAFARQSEQELIVVIVPRLVAALLQDREQPCPAPAAWHDTRVVLPPALAGRRLLNHLTEQPVLWSSDRLAVAAALAELPVALLVAN